MSDGMVFDVSMLTKKLSCQDGDFLIISLPYGLSTEEIQNLSDLLHKALQPMQISALLLAPGMTFHMVEATEHRWLAENGLALRGYRVPGDEGRLRYKVLHLGKGQLSDAPSYLDAIEQARIALQGPPKI